MTGLDAVLRRLGGDGHRVDVARARELQERGAVLLDVRTDAEFRSGHAPAAHHLPVEQLAARLAEVPAGRPVLAICRSGRRSATATRLLRRHGIEALDVRGGMLAWQHAGLRSRPAGRP